MGATLFKGLLGVWGTLIVGIGVNWVSEAVKWQSLLAHPWLTGASLLLLAGGTGWSYPGYRYAEAAKHFALCKEAKDLLPIDLKFQEQHPHTKPNPDYRPYNTTYISRTAVTSTDTPNAPQEVYDEPVLVNLLRYGQGLVFIGAPGAGKTRTLFSLLRNLGHCFVLQPKLDQPVPPDDAFRILKGRPVVVLLNDLDRYANHSPDLQEFCQKARAHALSVGVAATCRDGKFLGDVTKSSLRRWYEGSLKKLTLVRLTEPEQQRLAKSVNRPWKQEYATPGDIVLEEMRGIMKMRFADDLSLDCQDVLRTIKLLTAAQLTLTTERLQVAVRHIFEKSPHIMDCLWLLADQSFVDKRALPATIDPDDYYLVHVVPYERGTGDPAVDFPRLMDALDTSTDTDGLYTLGRVFFEQGDKANAEACLTKVLHLQPDFLQTLRANADEAYAAARYQEALELYDYLLVLQPNDAQGWRRKGYCLFQTKRYEDALVASEEAIKLQPDLAVAWYNKGLTLRDLGRDTEALTAFERALYLNPDLAEAWGNRDSRCASWAAIPKP